MDQQALTLIDQETLDLFELFDWWQPARLAEQTTLSPDRAKYLTRLRKEFNKLATGKGNFLTETQVDIATTFYKGLRAQEYKELRKLLPGKIGGQRFRYVDLFAGIGGIGKPFADIGGQCVLTCEWDEYARKTYRANWALGPHHRFVSDIKSISQPLDKRGNKLKATCQANYIRKHMPDHDVLLAGFPCQPFSIAGVSKKNALNRAHGFDCEDQGQLFFDICRILSVKQPPIAVLENVKNLKSHNKGTTFQVIQEMLTHLPEHQKTLFGSKINKGAQAYWIANLDEDKPDPKVIDGQHFLPQHRERIVLVCIRQDIVEQLNLATAIDLRKLQTPEKPLTLKDVLDPNKSVNEKYTLTPKLWKYLEDYAKKHKAKGNGFGYGMVRHSSKDVARTLSARYYKDGSEILINQDNIKKRPRRLTPEECARLMGFVRKGETFHIPVSDTRAYKQFGNSVVVPVFAAVANLLEPHIDNIRKNY